MDEQSAEEVEGDWHLIRVLDNRIQQGEALALTDDVRDLLRRTAPTVAVSTAELEAALTTVESTTSLLREMRRRITEGSHRLGDALHLMYRFRDKGDLEGARQQMRDVLAVEVVPFYREIAEGQLDDLS